MMPTTRSEQPIIVELLGQIDTMMIRTPTPLEQHHSNNNAQKQIPPARSIRIQLSPQKRSAALMNANGNDRLFQTPTKIPRGETNPSPSATLHQGKAQTTSNTPTIATVQSPCAPSLRVNLVGTPVKSSGTIRAGSLRPPMTVTPSAQIGLPPPIPSPAALAGQVVVEKSPQTFVTPTHGSTYQSATRTHTSHKHSRSLSAAAITPSIKKAQWLGLLNSAGKVDILTISPSLPRSVTPSPNSATKSPSCSPPHSSTDRFIPARKNLAQVIALVQTEVNEQTYNGHGAGEGKDKENPAEQALAPIGSPTALELLEREEHQQRFRGELATELLDLPSPNNNLDRSAKKKVTRVLFPSPAASPPAHSPGAYDLHSTPIRAMDHQSQLARTYRSGESAASTVASGGAGSNLATSNQRRPGLSYSTKRTLTFPAPPTASFTLAQRQSLVSTTSMRVLDCPGLINDYYLNLLHWSSHGIVAIALGCEIYLWNEKTSAIDTLTQNGQEDCFRGGEITSIRWTADGKELAVGYKSGILALFDVATKTVLRTSYTHQARISALDWSPSNANIIASGGLDTVVKLSDMRLSSSQDNSIVATYDSHQEEVCGLSFSLDGMNLASGANDNKLCIWSLKSSLHSGYGTPSSKKHMELLHHQAAVKALAWCPWSDHTLASGGGLADGHIRFCSSITGEQTHSVNTASQVCSLQWSKTERELISAHGHPDHSLVLWKFPELTKIATMRGHTSRVLHTALSPDGSHIVSAGADETIRFWKVWNAVEAKKKESKSDMWLLNSMGQRQIR